MRPFSPDGSLVVTASADKTARVWELATGKSWTLRGHPQEVIWADFSRDGQSTVVTIGEKAARIWTNETEVQVRGHADWVNGADFSPGGEYVVTASQDGTARIWETSTGHSVADLLGHTDTVFRARFSPDGESVVTASADHTARLWSVPKSRRIAWASLLGYERCFRSRWAACRHDKLGARRQSLGRRDGKHCRGTQRHS